MLDFFSIIQSLLLSFGYFALFGIVFAESGLFFGFFFPGDSLLFAAGLLASQQLFSFPLVLALTMVAAVFGDQVGYWTGARFGKRFFSKSGSFFRDPKRIQQAEEFYAKHGKKTIVLARFVPVVRTFAPIVAGTARMDYRAFTLYNILGGILWSLVFVSAGFLLGSVLPNSGDFLTVIILAIIVVSLLPVFREYWKNRKKGK
jgi:membrane-associated protein